MNPTVAGIIALRLMLVLMFVAGHWAFAFCVGGFVGVGLMLGFDASLSLLRTIPLSQAMTY